MRNSTRYAVFFSLACLVLSGLLLVHPTLRKSRDDAALIEMRRMAGELGLTDLCLFSAARYTRHLSQADLHSAFQDHPVGLEHFPAGSLVRPPAHLMNK